MRSAIAAVLAVAAGLVVANMLGVAAAEAPTGTTPVRTVSVEGVATVPIAQNANLETADAVYRQGMAAAMSDGQNKAEFLAAKAGVALGVVQSVVEDGGWINCTGGEESNYAEYLGAQPDFGTGRTVVSPYAATSAPAARTAPTVHRTKKRPVAKKASAATCTLNAQISLVYAIA
jgi:hypothetical protein